MGSYFLVTLNILFMGGLAMVQIDTNSTSIIDPDLLEEGKSQTVVISFAPGIKSVLEFIDRVNFSSVAERRTALTNAQQAFSFNAQKPLQRTLRSLGVAFESFWINNRMVVQNANLTLIQTIAETSGVARIEREPVVGLLPIEVMGGSSDSEGINSFGRQGLGRGSSPPLLWHIGNIKADKVWEQSYKGKGVVIASIDSGVRYTHESLIDGWRKEYGWYDPFQRTEAPNDQMGHGSHTMGTIAGRNGIGVAPESTWIACKGCSASGCGISQLYSCGQWVQCPTKANGSGKDCSYAADIVSNSWAGTRGDWYDDIIASWKVAKIIAVFGIGNSGPACSTASSPGDRKHVIGVGSVDHRGRLSTFSSVGPASDTTVKVKPDIAAPGEHVLSAWHTGDKDYATSQGTSMACPHVSGVIGLMKQKRSQLTYNQAYSAITSTAETSRSIDTTTARTCGGKSPSTFPNNAFGYGRIDALNAVNAV